MIGSSASTFSGLARRRCERSAISAIKVPSSVVPAAVASARNSVFQAAPQRALPTTQARPQTRSLPMRSARLASATPPVSSRKAPVSAFNTGSAMNSSSSAAQPTTAPATKKSARK